ncbi:hypothetical protein MMM5_00580 [Helicobacter pylori]
MALRPNLEDRLEKIVYVEGESDKIFLTLLNKVKIYALMVLLVARAIPSFLKKQRLLKNT